MFCIINLSFLIKNTHKMQAGGADFSPDKVTLVEPALNLVANGLVIACVSASTPSV